MATEIEDRLRALCAADRIHEAARLALESYGPEITSYLAALLRREDDLEEAFAIFAAGLWSGLRRFRWECSLRTWAYTLAHRGHVAVIRDRTRRRREFPSAELEEVAARVRTETLEYLRTASRERLVRLREELSPEDQTLLILRVDRDLSWRDIARVLGAGDDRDAARATVALRKRFERVKERLRRRMRES